MSIPSKIVKSNAKEYSFGESLEAYDTHKLFDWINGHPEKHKLLPTSLLLDFITHDFWGNFHDLRRTNFSSVFEDESRLKKIMRVDLSYPIVLTNFNRLIDGVHRLFKAVFQGEECVKAIFIDQSQFCLLKDGSGSRPRSSHVEALPIEDIYLSLPSCSLPESKEKRKNVVEEYFPDHLPTAVRKDSGFQICLERPSSPYGCYEFDESLKTGLDWWQERTRVRDICAEYRLLNRGILALEEQWVPLSWSRAFQSIGKIPDEFILLHLDDHQDMMPPRVGKRLDGEMVDYITGDQINFLDPLTVEEAIRSGAIGKGSILTPLIWQVPKIHVRHLTFRPHPNTTYKIDRVTFSDNILFHSKNRIGLHFSDTSWENLDRESSYVVTPKTHLWLDKLPKDVPILLHFDLDFFNNRFDGNSNWQKDESARSFDPRFTKQKQHLKRVVQEIRKRGLQERVIDTSIGISPGFFPAEFWEPMVDQIYEDLSTIGLNLTTGVDMSMPTTSRSKSEDNSDLYVKSENCESKRKRQDKGKDKASSQLKRVIAKPEVSDEIVTDSKKTVRKKRRVEKSQSKYVSKEDVTIQKMASKKFEGWRIKFNGKSCGFVKFYPKIDEVFQSHVTVFFSIPKPHRGKHIGRFGLAKAVASSAYSIFVGHLRKNNAASKKALEAAGFKNFKYPKGNQLCMVYRK